MPILTFQKKFKDDLLNGKKWQTTRYNLKYWWKVLHAPFPPEYYRAMNSDGKVTWGWGPFIEPVPLKIWCPTPRSGNGVHLFDITDGDWMIAGVYGSEFALVPRMAEADGFSKLEDLIHELMNLHHLTREEFDAHMWAVIRWREKVGTTDHN
jgi:hypothetical protein